MNRTSAVTLFLGVLVAASFVFASIEFRRLTGALNSLEERVGRVETAAPARAGQPSAGEPASRPGDPAPPADLASEIAKLREDLAALRSGGTVASGQPASGNPADGSASAGGPRISSDDVSRAVVDALAKKEKSDKEKQARAYKKQLEASAKSWVDSLAKKLELTETQKSQMSAIFVEQWGRMNTMWTDSQENENAEPVDYNKLQEETNTKVKQIMTPEQAAKYDELMKKGMWGGSQGNDAAGDGESSR